jgi:hypothetical protein
MTNLTSATLISSMLMTLSWRFLLILVSEKARRLSWGVAPNPAGRAFELGNALRCIHFFICIASVYYYGEYGLIVSRQEKI